MTKRLVMLEKMTAGGSDDPFHWYALGMEYLGLGRLDDAVRTWTELRARKPTYVPMYLMCGTALAKAGRREEARSWLTEGIGVARVAGDSHAQGELETALAELGS